MRRDRIASATLGLAFASSFASPVLGGDCNLEPSWRYEGTQDGEHYGEALAAADVNGDGYDDLILGSREHDVGNLVRAGLVEVFHGGPSGPSPTADWSIEGQQQHGGLGWSVDAAGDVNGDGFEDLIVGEPGFDVVGLEGRARIYLGSATGLETTAAWEVIGNGNPPFFGSVVASAGDVDGDGYDDVVVTQSDIFGGGIAFVFLGSPAGPAPVAHWSSPDGAQNARGVGDVDGDGYDDVVTGDPLPLGENGHGVARLYAGSAVGPGAAPAWTATVPQDWSFFGWSVAPAGDVDADGYDDVVIGAPEFFAWFADEAAPLGIPPGPGANGLGFLYLGSPAGLDPSYFWRIDGDAQWVRLGNAVALAGDVDGDGRSNFLMAAQSYVLLHRVREGETAVCRIDLPTEYYGISAAPAGDLDGDGLDDFALGSYSWNDTGAAFVYRGVDGD